MKEIYARLLAVILCLSLVACGGDKMPDAPQQDAAGSKTPTLEEILCNDNWYYVGLRTSVGLDFNADGTVSNGTWTLNGTTLDCVWKNGTATRFEIRTVNGAYFMTDEQGLTLYHYGTKPADWHSLSLMPIQVLSRCWEDHLEVVCVDGQYRLQLKKQYMQALIVDSDYDSYLEITYSQGDRQGVQARMNFDTSPGGYYIEIENPAEVPLEIDPIGGGVIYILTNLM